MWLTCLNFRNCVILKQTVRKHGFDPKPIESLNNIKCDLIGYRFKK